MTMPSAADQCRQQLAFVNDTTRQSSPRPQQGAPRQSPTIQVLPVEVMAKKSHKRSRSVKSRNLCCWSVPGNRVCCVSRYT